MQTEPTFCVCFQRYIDLVGPLIDVVRRVRIPNLSANLRRNLTGIAFVSPWLIGLGLLFAYPFAASLYWS
ncbi:MAG: hypothetical protein ABI614_04485, partial [Planctomycetota bacterium]